MPSSEEGSRQRRRSPFALAILQGLDPGPPTGYASEEEFINSPRLPVMCERASEPPAFRFMFADHGGAVVPYRCLTYHGLVRWLHDGWPGAAGDVLALDGERAVARFAWDHPSTRAQAEGHLRRWAKADAWELDIRPGTRPLLDTDPWQATIGEHEPSCPSCGAAWSREHEGERFRERFLHTRCRVCGEGRVWPYGLVRCPECREACGWLIEGEFGEFSRLSATCICAGFACPRCGKGTIREKGSNHFDEETGTVWHTPWFAALGGCERCRDREATR